MYEKAEAINLLEVINPFEYQGRIKRPELFFDRKEELHAATIVSEQIVRGRTGGVLVLGGRGSGKTSFLESLQRELDQRKIANAKLQLDDSMVAPGNEAKLFRLFLSELTTATQKVGLLESGIGSKLRQVFSGILKIEDIGLDLPGLSFVLKSAKEPQNEQFGYVILRDGLRDFMRLLNTQSSERRGAMLMLDEGDFLTQNKVLLEVLRNTFQETDGMGLVVAATYKIVEQVSDVFSPFQRGFRKIELGPFPSTSDVLDAIHGGLILAEKELRSRGLELEVFHRTFDRDVVQLTGRSPYEVNMLSYFAFEIDSSRIKLEKNKVTLFMKVDKKLLDIAIEQLKGTKEYNSFLINLDKLENEILVLLSKCQFGASPLEVSMLRLIDRVSRSTEILTVESMKSQIQLLEKSTNETQSALESILAKAAKYSIRAITSGHLGKSVYQIEDQWIRSFFKYGSVDPKIDLEFGFIGDPHGVRIFGDPIASIIDTMFLPKLIHKLSGPDSWRVNNYPNDGKGMHAFSTERKILNCIYKRTINDTTYHMAFQLKDLRDIRDIETEINRLMGLLQDTNLIAEFQLREQE